MRSIQRQIITIKVIKLLKLVIKLKQNKYARKNTQIKQLVKCGP